MNGNPTTKEKHHGLKARPFKVWFIALALVVAYFSVGKGRFSFIVAWAAAIPVWLKVISGLLLYGLAACVFVGMHRGVLVGRRVLHYGWLVAAVLCGFLFAVCMADNPPLFVGLSLGIYVVDLLCRGCVSFTSRKPHHA
jgi:hypothetical protein